MILKKHLSENLWFCYLAAFVLSAALYVATCAPSVLWQDSGMFQYRIWHNDVAGGLGLALAHPLYHLIGIACKAIPFGDFAYRINLISAVAAAFAVANIFLLLRLWLKEVAPALVGTITLALSWTFWQHAAIAEVYTLYVAIFTAELIFLYKFIETKKTIHFYLLFFFNGLSIANHMWGIIPLGCYGVYVCVLLAKKKVSILNLLLAIFCWAVGALPYLVLIVQDYLASGDIVATISSALFGNAWHSQTLNVGMTGRIVLENIIFIGYNFPTPNIILFVIGIAAIIKSDSLRAFNRLLLAMLVLFFVFAFRYKVPDRYAFFIPFYCLAAFPFAFGAKLFFQRFTKMFAKWAVLALALLPVLVYWIVPVVAEQMEISLGTGRKIPCRNEYTYFLRPWQMFNDDPERFATEALSGVTQNSIIFADGTTVYPLWYTQQVKGVRPDVKIVSAHGDYKSPINYPDGDSFADIISTSSVYVVSPLKRYAPNWLLDNYDFKESGVLYRVIER